MSDLIDRQAVKELAHNQMCEKYCGMALKKQRDFYIKLADSIIDLLPAIQPKRGKWIKISPANIYECSECGKSVMTNDICAYDFCHGCGAKMEVNNESN